jgi:hypothetical protein
VSRRAVLAGALAAASLAAGCGSPASDLFEVERAGSIPGAELRLVVSDDGTVRCNGGQPKQMGDPRLLTARGLQRDLTDQARGNKRLLAGRGTVLSYTVRLPSGTLAYSDSSPRQTQAMLQMQGFVRDVSKHVCGFVR